ncbi:MAG: class I SAM-dependent methyltransferase [Alphaproteobacteria bacterium]|nr:class I SAM-dependent methyltransferase [Alphaproteobacteria bacterium]
MTALERYLIQLIKAQGPLSIATFMAEALGNEKYGYYTRKDPFGQQGDFITAPEISQMFGEIIGLWHAENWLNMGRPDRIHLIEIGPGRGTLMQDALRAMKIVPGLWDAVAIHLVEISATLRQIQSRKLDNYKSPTWHNRISDVLDQVRTEPVLIIANEFFDALPIRQYQKTPSGWHERLVCVDRRDRLCFQLAPAPCPEHLIPAALHREARGSIVETCTVGNHIIEQIADHINHYGGAALIIDYGYKHYNSGDSLQAVKHHKYVDVLQDPGNVDLTAHVNFAKLKDIALNGNTRVYGPIDQGRFLNNLGIQTRAKSLQAAEKQPGDIQSALHRLTSDDEMGTLFKVMAVTEPGLGGISGFEG